MLGEQGAVDARLVIVALEARPRDEFDQVVIAVEVLGQEHQVKIITVLAAKFVAHAAWADVRFDA